MSLSDRQRDDLHQAILAYFKAQGLNGAHDALRHELALEDNAPTEERHLGLLEKKWTSVIRLQKKILDLEASLGELRAALPTYTSGQAQLAGKDLAEWIPRAPARHALSGHRAPITGVAFHPVFSVLATGSEDCSLKIWDFETGEFERTLKSHTKAVTGLDFSPATTMPDGRTAVLLASCSTDLTVKLWDPDNEYKCVRTLHGHDHVVSSVKFIPGQPNLLASASRDRSIRIWDTTTGFCTRTLQGAHDDWIRQLAPSPDGLGTLLTASSDNTARLIDANTGDCSVTLSGHTHVVECCTWSPRRAAKALCALAGQSFKANDRPRFCATGSRDKTVKLWDSRTGTCIATLSGHDNWIRAVVFHPDGRYLISASDDKAIKVWDLEAGGRCCRTLAEAHGHFVSCLAWGLSSEQQIDEQQEANAVQGSQVNGVQRKGRYVLASGGVDQMVKVWMP